MANERPKLWNEWQRILHRPDNSRFDFTASLKFSSIIWLIFYSIFKVFFHYLRHFDVFVLFWSKDWFLCVIWLLLSRPATLLGHLKRINGITYVVFCDLFLLFTVLVCESQCNEYVHSAANRKREKTHIFSRNFELKCGWCCFWHTFFTRRSFRTNHRKYAKRIPFIQQSFTQ